MSYSARNGRAPLDRFDVFAPHAAGVVVRIDGQDHEMIKALDLPGHSPRGLEPAPEYASGEHSPMGWWTLPDEAAESVPSTTVRYGYILSKVLDPGTPEERTIESAVLPDPRSMRQPQGVHELSCTYDPADFEWTDHDWGGADLEDTVLYEMHIGTFTPEGTFEAAIEHLDALAELGIDAVEQLFSRLAARAAGRPAAQDALLRQVVWETVSLSVISTAMTALLAFPSAYVISRLSRRLSSLIFA